MKNSDSVKLIIILTLTCWNVYLVSVISRCIVRRSKAVRRNNVTPAELGLRYVMYLSSHPIHHHHHHNIPPTLPFSASHHPFPYLPCFFYRLLIYSADSISRPSPGWGLIHSTSSTPTSLSPNMSSTSPTHHLPRWCARHR